MSIFPGNSVPSGTDEASRFARELALLLGVNAPDGSLQAEDLRVWGGALADVYDTESRASDQFFANLASDLLAEWEYRVGLPIRPNATVAARQKALGAKRSASGGDVMGRLLKAVRQVDPAATIETNSATAVASTNPRGVFLFAVIISPASADDPAIRGQIIEIVNQMKPAYTKGNVAKTSGFLCDDPNSLVDRDVLRI